jgi:ATP dependent DNA ligase C terminal region
VRISAITQFQYRVPVEKDGRSGATDRHRRGAIFHQNSAPARTGPSGLGSILLAYYDQDGRLVYAGRAWVGINEAELGRLWRRLQPLAASGMPLDVPPPRTSRFGSPLVLSRVH